MIILGSKILVVLIFVCATFGSATAAFYSQEANEQSSSRKDCTKKCNISFGNPVENPKLADKELLKLLKEIEEETDPEKLKELEKKKKIPLEKYKEKVEEKCDKICIIF